MIDFGQALNALRAGKRIHREGWNGKGQWVELQTPTSTSKMTAPYLFLRTVNGFMVPWAPSQTDVLAEDWRVE